MKNFASVLFAAATAFSISACGTSESSNEATSSDEAALTDSRACSMANETVCVLDTGAVSQNIAVHHINAHWCGLKLLTNDDHASAKLRGFLDAVEWTMRGVNGEKLVFASNVRGNVAEVTFTGPTYFVGYVDLHSLDGASIASTVERTLGAGARLVAIPTLCEDQGEN